MAKRRNESKSYFDWLVQLTGPIGQSYLVLLEIAFKQRFIEIVKNDGNRISDAADLEKRYSIFNKDHVIDPFRDYSVLEVMLALSERLNVQTQNPKYPDRTTDWFWKLVDNLGLAMFNDRTLDPLSEQELKIRLRRLVNREYAANGLGGLFPLKQSLRDQRRVEIWYQMFEFLESHEELL